MSIHGECFDNGMSGKCGLDCPSLGCEQCSYTEQDICDEIRNQKLECDECPINGCDICQIKTIDDVSRFIGTRRVENVLTNNEHHAKILKDYIEQDVKFIMKERKVKQMEILKKETDIGYEAVILAPGSTSENTEITINKRINTVTIKTDITKSIPKFARKEVELVFTEKIKLPEDIAPEIKVSIANGVIYIKAKPAGHIETIKIVEANNLD